MLGYCRCKPIIFNFPFDEVESDTNYILDRYFDGLVLTNTDLTLTTTTKIINRILTYLAYSLFKTRKHKTILLERLNDVAKISIEPRYVFDECLAFFGQHQIVLAYYSTLQNCVSQVLSLYL